MRRLLITLAILLGAGTAGLTVGASPALAAGCQTENAKAPIYNRGVYDDVETTVGQCSAPFKWEVYPTFRGASGVWNNWLCGADHHVCHAVNDCGSGNFCDGGNTVSVFGQTWDPTAGENGGDPNHLCAYPERTHVLVLFPGGSDSFNGAITAATC